MSTLRVNTLQNTSGVEVYTAKAWVNFNGTGTVAIRASGNVSSVTDNGVGDYTINFTTALADANYSANISAGDTTTAAFVLPFFGANSAFNTSSLRFRTRYQTGGTTLDSDANFVCVSVFR
jgi:hypothetical protein